MAAMLEQIGRRFQPVAMQKGLNLRVDSARDAEICVDRQKLERIISNLVDNAIKFTDRGTVALELVALYDGVAVRIADSGVGIPEACVPYLFDEFYQVNNHERDRNKGFGIGLAICRSLARQLGGDVRLVSTGSSGSCFEVVVAGIRSGRGGRSDREAGDHAYSQEPGLCCL
jgi:signal transduction histidine kinase